LESGEVGGEGGSEDPASPCDDGPDADPSEERQRIPELDRRMGENPAAKQLAGNPQEDRGDDEKADEGRKAIDKA
jgi:hypothetical protein